MTQNETKALYSFLASRFGITRGEAVAVHQTASILSNYAKHPPAKGCASTVGQMLGAYMSEQNYDKMIVAVRELSVEYSAV